MSAYIPLTNLSARSNYNADGSRRICTICGHNSSVRWHGMRTGILVCERCYKALIAEAEAAEAAAMAAAMAAEEAAEAAAEAAADSAAAPAAAPASSTNPAQTNQQALSTATTTDAVSLHGNLTYPNECWQSIPGR